MLSVFSVMKVLIDLTPVIIIVTIRFTTMAGLISLQTPLKIDPTNIVSSICFTSSITEYINCTFYIRNVSTNAMTKSVFITSYFNPIYQRVASLTLLPYFYSALFFLHIQLLPALLASQRHCSTYRVMVSLQLRSLVFHRLSFHNYSGTRFIYFNISI